LILEIYFEYVIFIYEIFVIVLFWMGHQSMNEIQLTELLEAIHKKIMKRFAVFMKNQGLSLTEGILLWRVRKCGPVRASELATHLGLSPSTLTGVLDRLVAGGWLERDVDPSDRRAVLVKSTAKLIEFTDQSMRASSESLQKSFKNLPVDVLVRLVGDLEAVLRCLEADEEKQG